MKPENCPKLETCSKIVMVMDKDMMNFPQYADSIRAVCGKCKEGKI